MSVNPGRSGQKFMPEMLAKVRWARERIRPGTRLEIDGGISPATVAACVAAGADTLVSASALFGARDRTAVIQALHAGGQPA
jgi:ribulose-phosphate 3-epimerase